MILAAILTAALQPPALRGQEGGIQTGWQASVPESDRILARQLYYRALDRWVEFDYDSALVLLRSARDADPADLATHLELVAATISARSQGPAELRREYAAMPDSPLIECLRVWVGPSDDNRASVAESLFELERRYSDEACPSVLVSEVVRELRPQHEWESRQIVYLARSVDLAPDWINGWVRYAAALAADSPEDATRVYSYAARRFTHPIHAIPLNMRRAGVLLQQGDVAGAEAIRRAVLTAVERDGRPGVRFLYLRELDVFSTVPAAMLGSLDQALRQQAELAQKYGGWVDEWQIRYTLGLRLTNRGEPLAALAELDRAVEIADSADIPAKQVRSLYKRAAAFVRTGRRVQAELDLLRAVELIPLADSPYTEAETWHGLLHLYDDDGRLEEALRASRRFLTAVESMPHSPLRMSAWLDAGELRWKAGQHASADEAFEGLIAVVDDFDELHAYAGRYFERIGDLAAARGYFERGISSEAPSADGVRSLSRAGLVRVLTALGALDSAEVIARQHDAEILIHSSVPMLPGILAEQGRVTEAAEISGEWARRRLEAGAVEGAANAYLRWADFLLQAGRPGEALEVADRADSLARTIDRVRLSADATRLQGEALVALGDREAALEALEEAARGAIRNGDVEAVLQSHLALGRLLVSEGRIAEALAAFDVAARQAEKTATNLELDFDRVRYREQRLAPYDEAILALVNGAADPSPADLLTWSGRRKAAALRLAVGAFGVVESQAAEGTPGVARVHLDDREILLDFNIVGDRVFVLIISPSAETKFVQFDISPDSVRTLVEALRRPFVAVHAGSLDLGRLRYPWTAASALYEAIVDPVLSSADGADRLLISPDGPLHRVSFASLVSGVTSSAKSPGARTAKGARYLVDDFEILFVPAANMGEMADRSDWRGIDTSRPVAIVFGEAPGTLREVEGVTAVWPGPVVGAGNAETTESGFAEFPARPAVLHIASHAIADDRDPYASHIRLASDSLADGLLHGAEITGLDLSGTLVVLSACETLEGPLFAGEGLLGLQRSFQATGADAVLATLWPVGPSAAELVGFFYEGLVRGDPPATALRYAQLRMRENPDTAHPFHWAGFVLHGGI